MLYIHFGHIYNGTELVDVDSYFKCVLQEILDIVDNALARKILLDVEGSRVINNNLIDTKKFGVQPSQKICGGVKALLLMNSCTGLLIAGRNCGDNCSKWIQYIAKLKDVRMTLAHPMEFSDPFEAICENTGKKLNSVLDYRKAFLEWDIAESEHMQTDIFRKNKHRK